MEPWSVEEFVTELTQNEIRYSRGFLRCNPSEWFEGIGLHWAPLLHSLGSEVELASVEKTLGFPDNLLSLSRLEIDGETAVLGVDKNCERSLSRLIAQDMPRQASAVMLDYAKRRFVSSLIKTWSRGSSPVSWYLGSEKIEVDGIVGSIGTRFNLGANVCEVWCGFGPRMVGRFDLMWREKLYHERRRDLENLGDENTEVSIELAELAVPPVQLIDYMKVGTVIDLEAVASDNVLVKADGQPWLEGKLRNFNSRLAVEVTSDEPRAFHCPSECTRVSVELARMELDPEGIIEHSQCGAVILTNSTFSSQAVLVIGGERVASVGLGMVDGRLVMEVLPK